MNIGIQTNAVSKFDNLSKEVVKEILKARRRGMNKAATKIKNDTRRNLKKSLPNVAKSDIGNGVRVIKYKEDKALGEAVSGVHILGQNKKGSREYILRFYEDGSTEDRKTKKGYNRGKLDGKHFFTDAWTNNLQKSPEIIDKEIEKALQKINN